MADNPQDLRYTKDHEWARVLGKSAVIGITRFAQDQLGDVVFVELPKPGDAIEAGKQFGVVESTKAVSELYAPLSGKVVKINDALVKAPDLINSDTYGQGWMIEVELSNPAELDGLMSAQQYAELTKA